MGRELQDDLVAYSVQNVGNGWRWRVYGPWGRVLFQGVEATEARAERHAADVFWRRTDHRIAA